MALNNSRGSKHKINIFILSVFFLLSFSFFKYVPVFGLIITDIWIGLVIVFLLTTYLFNVLFRNATFSSLEAYGLILMIVIPIIASYASQVEFNQPYIYGVLVHRSLALNGCMMIFLYFYRKGSFTLDHAERALIILVWFNLIINSILYVFVDASKLDEMAGFASTGLGDTHEGAKLTLNPTFVIFGFFYYAFKCTRYYSHNILLKIFFILFYLIYFYGGRSALLSILIVYFFLLSRWLSFSRKIIFSTLLMGGFFILGLLAYFFALDTFVILLNKFMDAIHVVMTGSEGADVSANARIHEVDIAIPLINKNLLIGNGLISNQWGDGYKGIFGYFYPSDIGLIGVVYAYGIIGFMLFLWQFTFALRYAYKIPNYSFKYSDFGNALKGFLLYIFISSIFTGKFVFSVEQSLLVIAILYCVSKEKSKLLVK